MPRLLGLTDRPAVLPNVDRSRWAVWDRSGWSDNIAARPVDPIRTARLADWDARIRVDGSTPLQNTSSATTKTLHVRECTFMNWVWERVPFPPVVSTLRNGDDQWFGVGLADYWEVSACGPLVPFTSSPWRGDSIRRFDLTKPWEAQGNSVTGAGVPMWPMAYGDGTRAMHLVLAGYSNEAPVGIARKTDGETPGHPCRAGERLRLTAAGAARLLAQAVNAQDLMAVGCWQTRGLIVTDKTDNLRDKPTVGHAVRLPAGITLNLTPRLTDFEVVAQ